MDLRTVQELMGHKTIAMTSRDAHLASTYQLAAVERLAEINRAIQDGQPAKQAERATKGATSPKSGAGDFQPFVEQAESTPELPLM